MAKQADKALQTLFAERLNQVHDELAPRVAEHMRPVLGNQRLSPLDQRRMFWQEATGWTPDKEAELRALGKSDVDIALLKYPWREALVKAGGRTALPDQVRYAQDLASQGPPPPEPLEALAHAVSPPEPAPAAPPEPVAMPAGAGVEAVEPSVQAALGAMHGTPPPHGGMPAMGPMMGPMPQEGA